VRVRGLSEPVRGEGLILEIGEVRLLLCRKEVQLGFLVRMLRVYALLLEPFVPTIAARLNYLLGVQHVPPVTYPQLKHLQVFILICLESSHGLKEPIPLVAESTSRLCSLP
jgi:hypothetical protein